MRGQEFVCEIVDTAGEFLDILSFILHHFMDLISIPSSSGLDEFTPFPTSYGLGVHGYVLVYSVASKQSFERIPMLNDKVSVFVFLASCACARYPYRCSHHILFLKIISDVSPSMFTHRRCCKHVDRRQCLAFLSATNLTCLSRGPSSFHDPFLSSLDSLLLVLLRPLLCEGK